MSYCFGDVFFTGTWCEGVIQNSGLKSSMRLIPSRDL